MGAACSGGVAKGNAKVGESISEKLEKIKGVSKLKGNGYSDSASDAFNKKMRKTDSPVSPESLTSGSKPSTPTWSKSSPATPTPSKPSTPSRTSKVRSSAVNLIMVVVVDFNIIFFNLLLCIYLFDSW